MSLHRPFHPLLIALALVVSGVPSANAGAEVSTQAPAPTQPAPQHAEHLYQWMQRHANLTLQEMLNALEIEPGFQQLPATAQQRLRDQLTALYKQNQFPHARLRPV